MHKDGICANFCCVLLKQRNFKNNSILKLMWKSIIKLIINVFSKLNNYSKWFKILILTGSHMVSENCHPMKVNAFNNEVKAN